MLKVGWCLDADKARFIFPAPTPLFSERTKPISDRAVQACPAVNDIEKRYFVLKNPFNIQLRLIKNNDNWELHVVEDGTRIDLDIILNYVHLMPVKFWRNENYPVIQIKIPYFFICDEVCYLTQLPPFMSPSLLNWPGILIVGRFPTHIWPRSLNWAFEWCKTDQDLILKKNTDLCYFYFESNDPTEKVKLVEAEQTPELIEYRNGISEVPKYVSNSFSLLETAKSRRPKILLKEKSYE